jgi:thioester reductase-like protein
VAGEVSLSLPHVLLRRYFCVSHVTGVCGRVAFPDAQAPERLPIDKLGSATGYVQSKWVAERLLEHAFALRPQSCGIYRPGAVTGDSTSGACNLGDTVNRLLVGMFSGN